MDYALQLGTYDTAYLVLIRTCTQHSGDVISLFSPQPPADRDEKSDTAVVSALKSDLAKLREEFLEFKKNISNEIRILTDDLDSERKLRAELQITVDRLKKSRDFRDKV